MTRRALGFLVLAVGMLACSDDKKGDEASKPPPPPAEGGILGNARFTYRCPGLLPSDAVCDFDKELGSGAGGGSGIPALAKGARFGLDFTLNTAAPAGTPPPVITALHPTFATVEPDGITLVQAGKTTLGLNRGQDVVDMLDVEVVEPSGIKIFSGDPQGKYTDVKVGSGSVQATVQFTFRFRAVPAKDDTQVLAGSFPCKWTTSDPDIANITTPADDNIVEVKTGTKKGTATVHVDLGPFKTDIPITVGG